MKNSPVFTLIWKSDLLKVTKHINLSIYITLLLILVTLQRIPPKELLKYLKCINCQEFANTCISNDIVLDGHNFLREYCKSTIK